MSALTDRSRWKVTKTESTEYEALAAHLADLQEKCERWHKATASYFLNEEEQAAMQKSFPASSYIRYDGGYPEAGKKKVFFLYDPEDMPDEIVCLTAKADQRFRKIGHRDILGALMHLQIDRHSFGDFWIEDDRIYLYTAEPMAQFLIDNLLRIGQLSISLERTQERPSKPVNMRPFEAVIASERLDAVVAGICHCSRREAKEKIRQGLIQVNHTVLEEPDEVCHNNVTISIRGTGRFVYRGIVRTTRNGRICASFEQFV